eukprot:3265532-Rhodomonas_salina.1
MEPPLAYMPVAVPAPLAVTSLSVKKLAEAATATQSCLCNRPCLALPVGAQGVHRAGLVDGAAHVRQQAAQELAALG